ncbi:heme-degrading domain-containing protein [Tabrizicola piscis]|uniref:Heme-degrading domain-containing protein n=1 Tax=Tabrizicola piscis TaxID=2494374 RepID=A0A3S8U1K2_9RHOB|nr:heme-degrading domain-containing protein [Tabrizicola piscis]AZL57481.1 heme-degrading domain-containing protein [Tabrizicola piscis]
MNSADLETEAATLVLPGFDETTALRLGRILTDLALAEALPVVIDIRTPDRTLFHAGLPGSAPLNDLWARRKSNTALRFHEASLLVGTKHREKGETLAKHGLDLADYADHGGAVPIRVAGVGVVAVATVSGLPQVEDHRLVVRGIRALMAG